MCEEKTRFSPSVLAAENYSCDFRSGSRTIILQDHLPLRRVLVHSVVVAED